MLRGALVEIRDIATGLWLWRTEHPYWRPGVEWQQTVTSVCVESGGEVAILDAIAPTEDARGLWDRLDVRRPTLAVVLKPDHVRDVDFFVRRYSIPGFGPSLFWPDDNPETTLTPIEPGSRLPGGLIALYDGRNKQETPLWRRCTTDMPMNGLCSCRRGAYMSNNQTRRPAGIRRAFCFRLSAGNLSAPRL